MQLPEFATHYLLEIERDQSMRFSKRVVARLRNDFNRSLYRFAARRVLFTPPLQPGEMPFTALSMVHQRDVLSYLVAIKSFARFANPERVIIVCDPTIGERERLIFKAHIPHAELRNAEEFRDSRIPQGGCWERLSAITTQVDTNYVVQIDADTVTVKAIPEVISAIQQRHGFVLGEEQGQCISTLAQTAENSRDWSSAHIQAVAEQLIASVGLTQGKYVRGCAGFTGFPPDPAVQARFFDFSQRMSNLIGSRWSEWGTEQVTSNFLVANAYGTKVLPFPKYATPDGDASGMSFMHFIGSIRFTTRLYERVSAQVIKQLAAR